MPAPEAHPDPDALDGAPPIPAGGSARREEILDRAEALVEAEGLDALTMRRLAEAVGIRAPSLYKHVRDKAELEAALQERALLAIGTALREATAQAAQPGRPGGDAPGGDAVETLLALGRAYRAWALAHPGLYGLATGRPLRRDLLTPGVEAWSAAPVVAAAGDDEHRARLLWASAHGLVALELIDRFPSGADLDRAWTVLAEVLGEAPSLGT
jgi:AcrR family transcriptional regulator